MKITRREFIRTATILGGSAYLSGCHLLKSEEVPLDIMGAAASDPLETTLGIESIYSVCQMCEGNCGLRARIREGVLVKLDGNPYHPNSMEPHIFYSTGAKDALRYTGSLCVKGQAGIQTIYDPYRIKAPLKRIGERGSGKWKTISWDEAITEIAEGGNIFGEGKVEGLRGIRDTETPIDRNAPELGARANQFVFLSGRLELGSRMFISRFMNAYGSVNGGIDDTSIRESSHRMGFKLTFDENHDHLKPDILNTSFLVLFGSSPLDSGVPLQTVARKLMKAKVGAEGGSEALQEAGYEEKFKGKYKTFKWVVVDPILSNSASLADQWIPVKPGTDAALALGMMRWIMENKAYDLKFLENTSQKAAQRDGEESWTNAACLVRMDNGELLKRGGKPCVWSGGRAELADNALHGELEVEAKVNNIPCKSVFQLLKERVYQRDIKEYARICGIESSVIEKLAEEFVSYGKRAVADFYGGAVQHANGAYTARTIIALNLLVGNIDKKGGLIIGGGAWGESLDTQEGLYALKTVNDNVKPSGIRIDRAGHRYEDTREFREKGYPSKRPWFPLVPDWGVFQEVIPGIAEGYPYPIKALLLYRANPSYSVPAMRDIVSDTLRDTKKVPLLIAIDSEITETNLYADYILPDTTYLERWDICSVPPVVATRTIGIRQPVVGNIDQKTGGYKPVIPTTMTMEDILIRIAGKLGLPGFGNNAFGSGQPLSTAWDFYKRAIAGMVGGEAGQDVPGLTEDEKVQYALVRGGRFEAYDMAYQGDRPRRVYGGLCQLYNEELSMTRDSMTGKPYDGLPKYEPITDSAGNELRDDSYPFQLVTYRFAFHSEMRTAANRWLLEILPENYILINPRDARPLGIKNGDKVKITSPNAAKGIEGKAAVREGIRPGVVGIPHGFARWGLGAKPVEIDGKNMGNDPTRGAGIPLTPLLRLDPFLKNVCLEDKIGANASFNDTRVKVVKI
ncbi:MAG: molybdopterin-dependent oxidoreductase [Syntrophales bacterium]|nr:molybdopterin-dependent oxidoreductase [Syntrophales bacterium]